MFKVRTRSVSFRISEEEFKQLHSAIVRSGARSFSEFARATLLRLASPGGSREGTRSPKYRPDTRLSSIEGRIENLEVKLDEVVAALAKASRAELPGPIACTVSPAESSTKEPNTL
jgi:hypothetical protein